MLNIFSKMSLPPEEERFFENSFVMADAIKHALREFAKRGHTQASPMMIDMAMAFLSKYDRHELIQKFIDNGHQECWDKIKERDEEFFIANSKVIFSYLPDTILSIFADLFRARDSSGILIMDDEFKAGVWRILDALIKISIKYVHKRRGPRIHTKNGKSYYDYTNVKFMPDVDIAHHANVWGLDLIKFSA
jgi:hypothetical protein